MTVVSYLAATSEIIGTALVCLLMVEVGIVITTYTWKIMRRITGNAEKNIEKVTRGIKKVKDKVAEDFGQKKQLQVVEKKVSKK